MFAHFIHYTVVTAEGTEFFFRADQFSRFMEFKNNRRFLSKMLQLGFLNWCLKRIFWKFPRTVLSGKNGCEILIASQVHDRSDILTPEVQTINSENTSLLLLVIIQL